MGFSASDQEWLWEETAHAVRRNRPLAETFRELSKSTSSEKCRRITWRLARDLEAGKTFSSAVADLNGTFQPGVAAAIEAGEKSGRLAEILDSLAEKVAADSRIRTSVVDAVAYPLVIAVAATAVMFFLRWKIFPIVRQIYDDWDVSLPLATELVLVMSTYTTLIVLVPAFFLLFFFVIPLRGKSIDAFRIHVPLLGGVVRRISLTRWCNTMGLLVSSGVPEGKALRIAGESTGNLLFARESRLAASMVDSGISLGDAMETRQFFPAALTWMVRAASSAGSHAHLWPAARDVYQQQAEHWSIITSIVLRMLFFVFAFGVVALTVLSMFLPLIRLMHVL